MARRAPRPSGAPWRRCQALPMRSLTACTAPVPLSSSAAKIISWKQVAESGSFEALRRKSDGA